MKNETELIKSTAKRQLTAKALRFVNKCILIMADQYGLTRYHPQIKEKKESLQSLLFHLIIDKKMNLEQIKTAIKNRKTETFQNLEI